MDFLKIHGECNAYLVKLSKGWAIIDSSAREFREHLMSEVEKVVPISEVKFVLLTHLHYDHCDNALVFPKAEIYASKAEIEDFKKNPDVFFFGRLSEEFEKDMKNKLKVLPKKFDRLEVIDLPGHTRGSVGFVDRDKKRFFSGDTLFNHGIGRTDFPNSVPEKMGESVDRAIDLVREDGLELMPGHDY